jgi:S-adenosylmethionine decarboxylase
MKKVAYLLSVLLIIPALLCADLEQQSFEFKGTHFTAEYFDCDLASITNTDMLICVMSEAVKESGATVLNTMYHIFPGSDGLTMLTMLSESHASIHTYPEHGECFVDLFTCGNHCSYEKFDAILRGYLKPGRVSKRVALRPDSTEEPETVLEEKLSGQDHAL